MIELLQTAIAAAQAHGATDAEVSAQAKVLGTSRFANSALTQACVIHEQLARVRVALGTRIGAATTSGLDRAALADAARQAVANARLGPEQPAFRGFARPDGRPSLAPRVFHEATAAFGPADRAGVLGPIFARAARDGLRCAGSFVTGPQRRAVVTAGGVAVEHELTEASLSLIALDDGASGYGSWSGGDIAGLDGAALAEEACRTAVASRAPVEVEPGAWDVVLSPPAVSELLEWMAMASFSARGVLDGSSLLAGREGEAICDPRVTVVDDVGYAHPGAIAWPFDHEGTTRLRVPLIDAGKAGTPVSDLGTAARLGTSSTGHAVPFGNDFGDDPTPSNLVMTPGDATVPELIRRVERGIFVTRFHYVNGLLDTRRATMTGMTRDGTFLIEDGKLSRPIKNLRFTESILDAFGRVGGIGRDLKAVPTHWIMVGSYLVPSLLVRGFRFTGKSR